MLLNPDFSSWSEQSGQVVGRELGWEEWREGNPGNNFEPSPQSPHSLLYQTASEQALLAAVSLFILFATSICISIGPHAVLGRACLPLGSSALSKAVMILGGDFWPPVMKHDIYNSPSPFAIRYFFLNTSHGIVSFCLFSTLICSFH